MIHSGFIDKRRAQKGELLGTTPIRGYDSQAIRELRSRYQISQTVLALILNTSSSAVRQWENGDKRPGGTALKLLNLLDRKGLDILK